MIYNVKPQVRDIRDRYADLLADTETGWQRRLTADLTDEFPGLLLDVRARGRHLHLAALQVPRTDRRRGIGSAVLRALAAAADQRGLTCTAVPTADLGADLPRLRAMFGRHGYVPGTGSAHAPGTWVRPAIPVPLSWRVSPPGASPAVQACPQAGEPRTVVRLPRKGDGPRMIAHLRAAQVLGAARTAPRTDGGPRDSAVAYEHTWDGRVVRVARPGGAEHLVLDRDDAPATTRADMTSALGDAFRSAAAAG